MPKKNNTGFLFQEMAVDTKEAETLKEYEANSYYLSISALQKCVRRGMNKEAIKWARIAYRLKPYALFQRFHTILFEDCAFDLDLIRRFHETRVTSGDEDILLNFVDQMCDAKKADNSTCALSLMITGSEKPTESMIRWLVENGLDDALNIRHGWELYKYQWYDDHGNPDLEWLTDVCERSNRFDRERLAVCIPLLFDKFGVDTIKNARLYNEAEDTPMINGWIPACAMDGHTRPGLISIRVLFSRLERVLPAKFDKNLVFYYEGGLRNNKVDILTTFKDVFIQEFQGIDLSASPVREFYEKYVKEPLNEVREWVVNEKMKDSFEYLKDRYDEV
jgi:hypothetical protein